MVDPGVWFWFGLISVLWPFDTFAVSYLDYTVPWQASWAVYQYLVHILSPVTDNCSSWISWRGRMAVDLFFHDQVSMKECAGRGDRTRGRLHAKSRDLEVCLRSIPAEPFKNSQPTASFFFFSFFLCFDDQKISISEIVICVVYCHIIYCWLLMS